MARRLRTSGTLRPIVNVHASVYVNFDCNHVSNRGFGHLFFQCSGYSCLGTKCRAQLFELCRVLV